ncbi:MAG: DUF4388 domain-containing protein [Candidatus Sericytochromatia bacterium]
MEFKATMTGPSLPNILKLFSSKKVTGALEVSGEDTRGIIWIKDGQILYAYSSKTIQLKDAIKSLNILPADKFSLLDNPSLNDFNMDKFLMDNALVPDRIISYIRSHQCADSIYSIFDLDKVDYELKSGVQLSVGRQDLIPANNWVAEIYQNMYSWVELRKKLPKNASKFKIKNISNPTFTKEEEKIYKSCDGNKTIKDLILWSGTSYFKAFSSIVSLVSKGFFEIEEDISKITPKVVSEIIKVLDSMEQMPGIKTAFVVDKEGKIIAHDSRRKNQPNEVDTETMAAILSQTVSNFEDNLKDEASVSQEAIEQLWVERSNGDKTLLFIAGKIILVTEAQKDCDWGLLKLSSKRTMTSIKQLVAG